MTIEPKFSIPPGKFCAKFVADESLNSADCVQGSTLTFEIVGGKYDGAMIYRRIKPTDTNGNSGIRWPA